VWPSARRDLETTVRTLVTRSWSRRWLNTLYRRAPLAFTGTLHERFAKLFAQGARLSSDGLWEVDFAGRRVRVALRADTAWLDWDAAMSVLGHEVEIKQTYAALLRSARRPDFFVDVGANYGLHSLLFLVHGIPTLTFEPNPACHAYFHEICELNGVVPEVRPVALGDRDGSTRLWFPQNATWLGTIDGGTRDRLAIHANLVSYPVRVETLDRHLEAVGPRRVLVKIDTEGSELAVLQGARRTLERHRPLVVCESFPGSNRRELHALLASFDYGVTRLPWRPAHRGPLLDSEGFLVDPRANFIAIPREHAP
jgi:FkbM family methyltransferase